jgi:hypothetical protein
LRETQKPSVVWEKDCAECSYAIDECDYKMLIGCVAKWMDEYCILKPREVEK